MTMPAGTGYGTISFRAGTWVVDVASDPDSLPEFKPLSGYVELVPVVDYILVTGSSPPMTLFPDIQTYQINDSGYMVDDQLETIIGVVANDAFDPQGWQYEARIVLNGGKTRRTFRFTVATGQHKDLTLVTPVPNVEPVGTIMGPRGYSVTGARIDPLNPLVMLVAVDTETGTVELPIDLVAGPAGDTPSSRTLIAGVGMSGGGDLTANRTFNVVYGTTAGTAAQGNDGRFTSLADRVNHIGTQSSSSISDFTEAVQDVVAGLLAAGTNLTLTYNDALNTLTLDASGGSGGSTDPEVVRDTIGVAMTGAGAISVQVNDAADTIVISTTATANDTDANLRDRATHTGTQDADTLTDGTTKKAFLATERTKLTGIASGATANDSDANLKARANHTGTQLASTISDFAAAAVPPNGSITNSKLAADAVTNAQVGGVPTNTMKGRILPLNGNVQDLTVANVRGLLNVADGSTANSPDATLLARANHTGTQLASTISDFAAAAVPPNGSISLAKLADVATATIRGRIAAGTGVPQDLTAAQARTVMDVYATGTSDAALAGKQPLDTDLTNLAGLTATTDNFLVAVASAWASLTPTQARTVLSVYSIAAADAALALKADASATNAALAGKQPLDSDLTTIAGLVATTDNFLVAVASAWASRTPAQVKTTLALTKADVGLANVANVDQQNAVNLTSGIVAPARLGTGSGTAVKFLREDSTFQPIPGGGDALVASPLSQFAATTSLQLKGVLSDETGSGAAVFANSPALVTPTGIVKGDVGLGLVDNTSDAAKPVSTAQQTALDVKQVLDADLTTIASLTATTDNFLVAVASAWASRTPAQVRTTLNVADGATANSSDATLLARANHTGTQLAATISDFGTAADARVAAAVGVTVQGLDADLTTLAGLTATTDNFLVSVASAWASRTPAQVRTTLALVIGTNVQAWSAALDTWAIKTPPAGVAVGSTDVQTLTNKRITKRINTVAATEVAPTANADTDDTVVIPGMTVNVTVGAPTGTPTSAQQILYRFKDNGTARTIAWNAVFRAIGVTLPATTVAGKMTYVGTVWNGTDSKWDVIAVGQEA